MPCSMLWIRWAVSDSDEAQASSGQPLVTHSAAGSRVRGLPYSDCDAK